MLPPTIKLEEVALEAGPAIKDIITHLACYGCLPLDSEIEKLEASGPLRQYTILSMGLAKFQEYAEIPKTGIFDIETANHINKPHCHNRGDMSRNVLNSALMKWYSKAKRKKITYCFNEYSHQLTVHEIRDTFEKAFKVWEDRSIAPVTFMEVAPHPGKGNIRIRWTDSGGGGEYGPVFVAYQSNFLNASTPIQMYFDEDTKWTVDNLRRAVVHQVGHILGLPHSRDKSDVMWPGYTIEE